MANSLSAWLRGETDTVLSVLERAVDRDGTGTFLDFEGSTYSFIDVWNRAASLAAGLKELSVTPGETVVSMLDNNVDAVAMWFASNFIGAVHVAVNTALKGEFLGHIVVDSGARVVVVEEDLMERFPPILDSLSEVKHFLYRGDPPAERIDGARGRPA